MENGNAGYILVTGLAAKELKFNLSNIHFHTPSEHAFDSKLASIEAHFVHSLDTNYNNPGDIKLNKLVIGVLYNATVNVKNTFLESLGLASGEV